MLRSRKLTGGEGLLLSREGNSYSFVNAPSAATATPLCEVGVHWVGIDPDRAKNADWSGLVTIGYEDDSVIVGELNPTLC